MELSAWVKAARKHRGWTLAELGEVMGRSKSNVGLWEAGTHHPSYAQVQQIAAETGFPLPNEVELDEAGNIRATRQPSEGFSGRVLETSVIGSATIVHDDCHLQMAEPMTMGALSGIKVSDAYAVRVSGSGASPIVKHGDFLLVGEDGKHVPAHGDFCILSTDDGQVRFLEFVDQQGEHLSMTSRPGAQQRHFGIARESLISLEVVLGVLSKNLWRPPLKR